jgi:hypothetical protein
MRSIAMLLFGPLAAACVTTAAGTRPQDMTLAGHEAAASREDANLAAARSAAAGPVGSCLQEDPCWQRQAVDERTAVRVAAAHRQAAAALRQRVTQSCQGIPESEWSTSPFARSSDLLGVQPLYEPREQALSRSRGNPQPEVLTGAVVSLAPSTGLSLERLRRVVGCRVAWLGAWADERSASDPLAARGASATVRSGQDHFDVEIRADDAAASADVLRRAEALRGAP